MDGIFCSIDIVKDIEFIAFTHIVLFIINVNVLFLSNSQLEIRDIHGKLRCLSSMSMFSF